MDEQTIENTPPTNAESAGAREIPQPARQPYNVEFMQHSNGFCEAILGRLPELVGVAIIPIWENQPENAPPGILRLRDPSMPYAATLIQLLNRMAVFNMAVHSDLVKQVKILNGYVGELSDNIREKLEELNALNEVNETNNKNDPTDAAE
jgi:hypothetical protein